MKRALYLAVPLAILAATGFGIWHVNTLTAPAAAATITKASILEEPVAPKVAPRDTT